MPVKVIIPTPLRPYAGKQPSVEFDAKTVGEALERLTSQYEELRKHLYTDDGRIRSFVNVYVNDEDIRYLEKEATRIQDGDTISIIPSIAGGSSAAPSPWTLTGKIAISRPSHRRRRTVSMSRTAAPCREVTSPIFRGKAGRGFFRSGSKRPSSRSFFTSCS